MISPYFLSVVLSSLIDVSKLGEIELGLEHEQVLSLPDAFPEPVLFIPVRTCRIPGRDRSARQVAGRTGGRLCMKDAVMTAKASAMSSKG